MGKPELQEDGAEEFDLRQQWFEMIEASTLGEYEREIMMGLDDGLIVKVMECGTVMRFITQLPQIAPDAYLGGDFDNLQEPYNIIVELLTEQSRGSVVSVLSSTREYGAYED
jgi:hypothetical protein